VIDTARLGEAADRLQAFDVDESGWLTEPSSLAIKVAHTLTHLEEDLAEQDFNNPFDAEWCLAPDAVMFAIRLGRWTGQVEGQLAEGYSTINVLLPTPEQASIVSSLSRDLPPILPQQVAFAEAATTLKNHLRERDSNDELASARRAARLLLYSADLQAEEHDFFLFRAFDARLASLRSGLEVPQT